MLDQEAGSDHADSVVHPPGLPQLSHPGIDDRVSGAAFFPRFEIAGRSVVHRGVAPREAVEILAVVLGGIGGELQDRVLRIIAPDQFTFKGAPAIRALVLKAVPHLNGRNLAEMQVGGEARDFVDTGEIALFIVIVDVGFPPVEAFLRGGLSHLPEIAHPPRPVGLGREQIP